MTPGNYCNECGNSHTKREKKASRKIERRYNRAPSPTSQSQSQSQSQSKRQSAAMSSPSMSMSATTLTSQSDCRCLDCGEVLQPGIDYFALSSALCNSYLYLDCMSVVENNVTVKPTTLSSPTAAAATAAAREESAAAPIITTETLFNVLAMFPVVRRYKGPHKLQRIAFLNQCYFVTHLVYTFSDWGQHSLHRNLFQPEYDFIVAHMDYAIEDLNVRASTCVATYTCHDYVSVCLLLYAMSRDVPPSSLPICLSIVPSVSLSLCLSAVSLSLCSFVCLSVCMAVES